MTAPTPAPNGLSAEAWQAIGARRKGTVWHIPEYDADGQVIGTEVRDDRGRKWMFKGSRRGLKYVTPLEPYAGTSPTEPILVVEGATDTAAGHMLEFIAIGRPSALGGAELLAALAPGRHFLVVGENDSGAGAKGAKKAAAALLNASAASVKIIFPPNGIKDLCEWVCGGPEGLSREELLAEAEHTQPWQLSGLKATHADTAPRRKSQATQAIELAEHMGLFHDPADGRAFADIEIDGHRETWAIDGTGFRQWLGRAYYREHGKAIGSQALYDAINTIAGRAQHEGPAMNVCLRIAENGSHVYLDLCDAAWRVVEVSPRGWRIIGSRECPVRFIRRRGMLPLPAPVSGGRVDELRPLINMGSERDWKLAAAFLVASLLPRGPYPILVVNGEQGSAKSTMCRMLRGLIDPSVSPVRRPPRDERDLMIAATNGWIVAFDNLSSVPVSLSDALCCLSTGAGFATRQLYSDDEEKLFAAQRPVLLNGIDEICTRPDLLDRALCLTLLAIPEDRRVDEAELWQRFDAVRPRVLGALLDAVNCVLANVASVKLDRMPRMADFAKRLVAAEPALDWPAGSFLDAYMGNRQEVHDLAVEASPIGLPLLEFMKEHGSWSGTATELLTLVEAHHSDEAQRGRLGWPKSARALSSALRRLAPNLRAIGIEYRQPQPQGKQGRRVFVLENVGFRPSAPSAASANAADNAFADDLGHRADGAASAIGVAPTPEKPPDAPVGTPASTADGADGTVPCSSNERRASGSGLDPAARNGQLVEPGGRACAVDNRRGG
ncbi:MAG: hypothetical protein WD009_05510 [Phycisphaeraceae bacterium]